MTWHRSGLIIIIAVLIFIVIIIIVKDLYNAISIGDVNRF